MMSLALHALLKCQGQVGAGAVAVAVADDLPKQICLLLLHTLLLFMYVCICVCVCAHGRLEVWAIGDCQPSLCPESFVFFCPMINCGLSLAWLGLASLALLARNLRTLRCAALCLTAPSGT